LRRKPALLLMLAVLTTVCGCTDQRLKPESRANLGRIDAIVEVNQAAVIHGKPQLGYEPAPPAPKTFAEAASKAISDGSATAYRKGLGQKIDADLWNFDFASQMATVTKRSLERLPGFDIQVRPAVSHMPIDTRAFFDTSRASAVLIFTVAYYFDGSDVIFDGNAALFPKTEALRKLRRIPNDKEPLGFGNTIFRVHFQVRVPAEAAIQDVHATFAQAAGELASRLADALAQ
jgi:hypothetical protein